MFPQWGVIDFSLISTRKKLSRGQTWWPPPPPPKLRGTRKADPSFSGERFSSPMVDDPSMGSTTGLHSLLSWIVNEEDLQEDLQLSSKQTLGYWDLRSGQTWISNYIRCNQDYVVLSCRNLYLILSDGLGGDLVLAGGEGGGCGWPLPPGDCVLEAGLGGTIVLGLGMGARGQVGSAVVAPVKKKLSLRLYLMYTIGLAYSGVHSNEVFSRNPWVFS